MPHIWYANSNNVGKASCMARLVSKKRVKALIFRTLYATIKYPKTQEKHNL